MQTQAVFSQGGTAPPLNWRTEFHDPKMESLFRHSILPHHACQLRLALCVIALLFLVFALADYIVLGSSEAFPLMLAMRLTTIAACLLLALAVWRRPAMAQRALPVNLICLLGITALLLTLLLRPLNEGIHVASLVVASMTLYLFVPNRLPWMLTGNAYLLVGFLGTSLISASLPPVLVMTSLLLLLFTNLLGWLSITHLKRLKRLQFALLLEERSANQRLKEEIAERKALEARLREMACTDPLTGIANRRHFFDLAEQELRRARRDGTPLTLCMVDVDLFKRLNDRFGHAAGDRLLCAVAGCCQAVLRNSDVLGRYGGEEFVIALPLADLNTATAIAERLRRRVGSLKLPGLDAATPLTVTVGISRVEDGEAQLEAALLRADQALYEGKDRGRNCVVVARRPTPPPLAPADSLPQTHTMPSRPGEAAATAVAEPPAAGPRPDGPPRVRH